MKNLITNKYLQFSIIMLAGLFLGYLIFGGASHQSEQTHTHNEEAANEVWTCSMHPSVRDDGPGSCPICGMDLIPASDMDGDDDRFSLVMSESAIKLAEIQTVPLQNQQARKTLHLPGRVEIDERNITSVSAHFPGRITSLNVNFTGAPIRKGEVMATVYSPELVSAQRELLEALRRETQNPAILNAAREKLRQWELSSQQIREIEQSGEVRRNLEIVSPADGFVTALNVSREQYVERGSVLFEVADLSNLWAVFDVYEDDLPWISKNDTLYFHNRSNPSKRYQTVVSFVEPAFQAASRTVRVRADISGNEALLPEMILRGELYAMQPHQALMVPASAVLWTGPRSLVYVKKRDDEATRFEAREVSLGLRSGDFYVVEDGLTEGEEVVFYGAFKIDSEMQLADKFSMMNRRTGATEHEQQLERFDHVPENFQRRLRQVISEYITGKDFLVDSKKDEAITAFGVMKNRMEDIGEHGLSGSGHETWMKSYSNISFHLDRLLAGENLESMRSEFRYLSDLLIEAVKMFGIDGVVYQQYCPMAFGDEGAYWISDEDQILNPYLPETMLMCGEVIGELNGGGKTEAAPVQRQSGTPNIHRH